MSVTTSQREPISALSHLIALILVIPCCVLLIVNAALNQDVWHIVTLSIFSASIILMYLASTLYHFMKVGKKPKAVFRRIDHIMIYILIAGTYTPICLTVLRGPWGWTLFGLVWAFAVAGILLKSIWFKAPKPLSVTLYVLMGWIVVIAFYPLFQKMELGGIILLFLGGISYTIGALIYALKKPNLPFRYMGFHEIFHIFVVIGSAFHIAMLFLYL